MKYRKRRRFRRRRLRRYRRKKRVFSERVKIFKLRRVYDAVVLAAGASLNATVTDDPSNSQDWANIVGLFDMYRVAAIKVHFVPNANTREAPSVAGQFGFRPVYCAHDTDLINVPLSVNNIIQYENMKVKNSFTPWVYYRKMARRITTTNQTTLDGRGYLSTTTPASTQQLLFLFENFNGPANYYFGRFVITHYVCARNRN